MHQLMRMVILFFFTSMAYATPLNPAILHGKNDPYAGNPKGKITVVEFFDYQCSHCVNMAPVMEKIIHANPNLRVVFKEFPIRGPISEFASRAALAANKQGKYKAFYHALMNTRYALTESTILEKAKNAGLNIKQLKQDMNSDAIIKQLEANLNQARELNLNGTPAFIVSKSDATQVEQLNIVLGEMSQSELQNLIRTANL